MYPAGKKGLVVYLDTKVFFLHMILVFKSDFGFVF